eukprot:472392-Amphidinium_carterae.1
MDFFSSLVRRVAGIMESKCERRPLVLQVFFRCKCSAVLALSKSARILERPGLLTIGGDIAFSFDHLSDCNKSPDYALALADSKHGTSDRRQAVPSSAMRKKGLRRLEVVGDGCYLLSIAEHT